MSRHTIPSRTARYTVVVGYDGILNDLFAQVYDMQSADEDLVVDRDDTLIIEDIRTAIAPYADLPDVVRRQLLAERVSRTNDPRMFDHRPNRVATVLHADPPNFFGLAPADATKYIVVASTAVNIAVEVAAILDGLYEQTNSIDVPWFSIAAQRGLTVPLENGSPVPRRSTSVGDVIHIKDQHHEVFYMCAPVGWKPLESTAHIAISP